MEKKRANPLLLFFLLTFLWTWTCYGAIILFGLNPYAGAGMICLILGGCSPTFVGLILAMTTYPKQQKIEYLKRIYELRRIRLAGWITILLLVPAVYALAIGGDLLLGGTLPQMTNLRAVIANPFLLLPLLGLSFLSGPFSEELGWRGFALNPLLKKFGFAGAMIVLGVIWAIWHLPLYFVPQMWYGQMGFRFAGFPSFLLMSIGLCGIMAAVYLHSRSSILCAMLMHLSSNFTSQLLAEVSPRVEAFRSVLVFAVGVGIAVYYAVKQGDLREARSE